MNGEDFKSVKTNSYMIFMIKNFLERLTSDLGLQSLRGLDILVLLGNSGDCRWEVQPILQCLL